MIKLIGTILVLSVTLALGQLTPNQDIAGKGLKTDLIDYRTNHDTLTLVSTWDVLYFPFGAFKNYEGLKREYSQFCSKENEFYYLKDGESYVKLFQDDNTEALGTIHAKIYSPKIRLRNGIVIGMSKQEVFTKLFKTLPDKLDGFNVLKLESGQLGIWHYYRFENNVLTSFCFDAKYKVDKN